MHVRERDDRQQVVVRVVRQIDRTNGWQVRQSSLDLLGHVLGLAARLEQDEWLVPFSFLVLTHMSVGSISVPMASMPSAMAGSSCEGVGVGSALCGVPSYPVKAATNGAPFETQFLGSLFDRAKALEGFQFVLMLQAVSSYRFVIALGPHSAK